MKKHATKLPWIRGKLSFKRLCSDNRAQFESLDTSREQLRSLFGKATRKMGDPV
jgi:hypothetical protein